MYGNCTLEMLNLSALRLQCLKLWRSYFKCKVTQLFRNLTTIGQKNIHVKNNLNENYFLQRDVGCSFRLPQQVLVSLI